VEKFDIEKFSLKKVNDVKLKLCQFKISNRYAPMEVVDDNVGFTRALESIRGNIKPQLQRAQIVVS
jgi:hypothetical protein